MRILAPSPRNGLKLFWHGDGSVSVVRPAAKSAAAILAMDAARSPRLARDEQIDGSSSLERLMSFLQDRLNRGDLHPRPRPPLAPTHRSEPKAGFHL